MIHTLDLFKLERKVALVTGGSRGLGFFAAQALAETGADVALCALGGSAVNRLFPTAKRVQKG